jgi:glycosyltransferase involved in cell wall biosynthesis
LKYLFISNSTKPSKEEYYSKKDVNISSFGKASILAALELGYEVHVGINRKYAHEIKSDYPVAFYDANIFRSIFDVRNILIAMRRLYKYLKNEKIDVLHCSTPIGGLIGRIIGTRAKTKHIIYTVHGFHFHPNGNRIKNFIYYQIEKYLAKKTDIMVTINKHDFEVSKNFRMKSKDGAKYIKGVGFEISNLNTNNEQILARLKSELNIKPHEFVLLTAGDLNKNKNVITAIKAVEYNRDLNVRFLICGEGPLNKQLSNYIETHGLKDKVSLLGYRNDIKDLLLISSCYIQTSKREGLPRSIMEAMDNRLPVICSNIRGNTDLVDNELGGYCVEGDFIEYAVAIKKLINNGKIFNMGFYNKNKLKDFSFSTIKQQYIELLTYLAKF